MTDAKAGTANTFDVAHLLFVGGHWLAGLGWRYEQGAGWRKPDGMLAGGPGDHGQAITEALSAEAIRLLHDSPKEDETTIYEKSFDLLKRGLTMSELIALGKQMDRDPNNGLLDLLDKYLAEAVPGVFADPVEEEAIGPCSEDGLRFNQVMWRPRGSARWWGKPFDSERDGLDFLRSIAQSIEEFALVRGSVVEDGHEPPNKALRGGPAMALEFGSRKQG